MSKLSFRARALDASKPMPIYMAEELPDLPDYSAINRAVPQMPSGMQKEEESEHHLQRAIRCTGLIIPTPEVTSITNDDAYDKIYPADYKLPRQLIHMQPFAMEQDIPDYDMDSEDENWVDIQSCKMDLAPLQFEEMMDRLEKSSGQTVVTLNEAKALLKEDDDLIIAVFDYWLNKRLKTQHPLLLAVKTEHRFGSAANNPYLAFRRRTEKMQTRKNRKNDETSYEKMLKLRRDLSRAVTLLELVKRREKTKREHLHLTIEVYEKRYQAQDFNGQILTEVSALKTSRPTFAPLFANQFGVPQNWTNKDEIMPRKEKRQYKKRKHKLDNKSVGLENCYQRNSGNSLNRGHCFSLGSGLDPLASSDEDNLPLLSQTPFCSEQDEEEIIEEGQYTFRRNKNNTYLPPVSGRSGNWPWCDRSEGGLADKKKYRFALTSINNPTSRCIGFARRRIGRGGRVILDRYSNDLDDIWSSLDFTILNSKNETAVQPNSTVAAPPVVKEDRLHFRPKTPPLSEHSPSEESSNSDSEEEQITSRTELLPYHFPPEATSICVDIGTDFYDEKRHFSSEFNISDYFSVDSLSSLNVALVTNRSSESSNTKECQTNELGCSQVVLLPEKSNLLNPQIRLQCNENTSSVSSVNPTTSHICYTSNYPLMNNTSMSIQCENASIKIPKKKYKSLSQISNVTSILSKSLTSPLSNKNSGASETQFSSGIETLSGSNNDTNVGVCHTNGPITQLENLQNSLNSTRIVNNQSTVVLLQKQGPSHFTPSFNKFDSFRKSEQQTKNQTQQITKSKEITFNNNR